MAIFPTFFFFRQYRPAKSLLWYFRTKKRLSTLQKHEVQKVKKLTFFQTNGFGPKMAIFPPFFPTFFFRQYRPGKSFLFDILKRKNAFLGYRNKKFKKSKTWHFAKGVNQWFWSKNGHFFNFFFLGNTSLENVFYDILDRKNDFLGYKNNKFKKSKNDI